MASITFKLPGQMKELLEQAAEQEGRSLSDFIRRHFKSKLATTPKPKKKGKA